MLISAHVLAASDAQAIGRMLPKIWKQFISSLKTLCPDSSDLPNDLTIAILPASTFVYLEDLQRVYEDLYLPDRADLGAYTVAEREDFQLQNPTFIPDPLVKLTFEGFQNPVDFQNEPEAQLQDDNPLDFALLATRADLLTAYEVWGLKKQWFDELNSHTWLKEARRQIGQGQRGHVVEPLFCPYLVMFGLVKIIRGKKRISEEKGWDLLQRHFPRVYQVKSVGDPREKAG